MFHVLGGYFCLSVAATRRVWLPFEDVAIFPNLYILYVGSAGNGKSWAMGKARRVLEELPDIQISGSLETPPGLWRFMNGNDKADPPIPSPVARPVTWPDGVLREIHPMTIMANEFVNFISLDERGWINALNDIYDSDLYRYRTKGQGEDILVGPYITMLGALTTEVSADLQKARIISTGLARRTLFQYGERQWKNPHARPGFTPEQKAARAICVEHLKKVQKLSGPFICSPEVNTFWKDWYDPHLASVPERPPQTQGWYATKSVQVQKLAMLTALGERGTLELCVSDFETALAFLENLEVDLEKIFGGVGRNELASVAIKMFEYVNNLPEPISLRTLNSRFFALCKGPNDFNDCINQLCSEGKIHKALLKKVGASGDDVLAFEAVATPQVLQAFVAAAAAEPAGLTIEVQTVMHPDVGALIGPSKPPLEHPAKTESEDQAAAQAGDGTEPV